MKRPIFKKGGAIDQARIERIERVVSRLVYGSRDTTTAIITPFPISNAVVGEDVNGTVLRYIFPCKGKITRGHIKLDKKPRTGVAINVKVFNTLMSESKSAIVNKQVYTVKTDLNVFPGDCLEVSVASSDVIKEVWVSMLWVPDRSVVDIESVMIEELDKIAEKFIEEPNA